MFFFVWFFIPETKGMSLESMDKLFGVTETGKADVVGHENSIDGKRDAATTQVEVR